MAMSGCFVPAEYASFRYAESTHRISFVYTPLVFLVSLSRIHNALLTRLSNDDDLEKSLSTFANEMASSAMILGIASGDSLVLVDELGRGTAPREGVGIAHAIAEHLIKLKVCFYVYLSVKVTDETGLVRLLCSSLRATLVPRMYAGLN